MILAEFPLEFDGADLSTALTSRWFRTVGRALSIELEWTAGTVPPLGTFSVGASNRCGANGHALTVTFVGAQPDGSAAGSLLVPLIETATAYARVVWTPGPDPGHHGYGRDARPSGAVVVKLL